MLDIVAGGHKQGMLIFIYDYTYYVYYVCINTCWTIDLRTLVCITHMIKTVMIWVLVVCSRGPRSKGCLLYLFLGFPCWNLNPLPRYVMCYPLDISNQQELGGSCFSFSVPVSNPQIEPSSWSTPNFNFFNNALQLDICFMKIPMVGDTFYL